MPITGLIGSQFGDEDDLYGRRPDVPEFPDFGEYVGRALDSNLANLPRIEDLAERSTALYRQLLDVAAPGATGLIDKGTSNIADMLAGELPDDVADRVKTLAAEASRSGGYGGSLFAGARSAKDLGLTSLNMSMQGLAAGERWLASAAGRTFDFSRMFLGPEHAIRQAEGDWSRDWLAEQVAASPDPSVRGAFDSEMAFLGMVLSAYGGGAGYTQGYRSPYQGGGPPANDPRYDRYAAEGASYFSTPEFNYGGGGYEGDVNSNPDIANMV